ncbi:MAG: RrF2 family transcriptional regulator [Planctomycetota bacterium]
MRISKKCQYGLRAVFELAVRKSGQPVKIHQIAGAQNIPPRFLEVILNQLRHAGFVESRRGNEGGYMLARDAAELTVGQVIRCIQGSINVTVDDGGPVNGGCLGQSAFEQLWQKVNSAVSDICDSATIAELVEYERANGTAAVLNYNI